MDTRGAILSNMRWLINYIESCFCTHKWELISDVCVTGWFRRYNIKTYRCVKCGYAKKYKIS